MKPRPYVGTWPGGSEWCNRPITGDRLLCVRAAVAREDEGAPMPLAHDRMRPSDPR